MTYCPECDVAVVPGSETCASCGTPTVDDGGPGSDDPATNYLVAGVAFGFCGLFFVPYLFAALAILCGALAVHHHRRRRGVGVIAWGIVAGVVGAVMQSALATLG